MTTTINLTPETILAAMFHAEQRVGAIMAALTDCRPGVYSSAYHYVLLSKPGQVTVQAKFEPSIRSDERPAWKSERTGEDFDAVCDQVLADIAACKADMFGSEIELLALAIIKIKHRDGTVTDRALRMEHFTQECITQIHERAALLANEMSDGKPFSVEFVGVHNEEAA